MTFRTGLLTSLLLAAIFVLPCACPADTIGGAKHDYADGAAVLFQGVSVTAVFPTCVYVENAQRIQGIRVDTTASFSEGDVVDVSGKIYTDPVTLERYVTPTTGYPQKKGTTLVLKPLMMNDSIVAGGNFGLQQGIAGAVGLNNAGMLVKIAGAVSAFDDPVHPTTWCKLNDGSGPDVKLLFPSGVAPDVDWVQASAVGICSMENVNGVMSRVIKVRRLSDVTCGQSWADNKVATMTLDQKVGQMFVETFTGSTVTSTLISQIQSQHIGGYCLMQVNGNMPTVTTAANLTNSLQTYAMNGDGIPLLISTDQEGGWITRINAANGGTPFPGNMAVGATRSYNDAFTTGANLGAQCKAIGVNQDFAPVLDCNTNPANPIIGIRSFGEDPTNTGNMGHGYLDGLHSVGCIATGKHFPGHGDTSTDSHTGLPVVTYPFSTLDTIHGKPFRDCSGYGIDCIMTAHIIVTCLDSTLPATLSYPVLTGYLRNNIGFTGVCITDSMGMGALTNLGYTNDQECAMALEAGNDIVLNPNNLTTAIAAVESAINSGALPISSVNTKVARVLRLKRKYGLFSNPYCDASQASSICASASEKAAEVAVADDAITVVKNANSLLPLNPNGTDKIYVCVCYGSSSSDKAADGRSYDYHLRDALAKYHTIAGNIWVYDNPNSSARTAVVNGANSAGANIVVLGTDDANDYSGEVSLVSQLLTAGKNVICIGQDLPYEFTSLPSGTNAYLAAYYLNDCNYQGAADTIFGAHHPVGLLPVTVSTSYPFGWGLSW